MIYLRRDQTANGTGGFTFHVKDGKKWITPAFIEVPLDTDFKDVEVEPRIEPPRAEDLPYKEWEIIGSRGNTYTVARDRGSFTCTCPASLFQRKKECKHILSARRNG